MAIKESDIESLPSNSPKKSVERDVKVKTLEEIKLDKIQAETAAYYAIPENETNEQGLKVKTLEEIKLDKIQAEVAAYYGISDEPTSKRIEEAEDLRQRILDKMKAKSTVPKRGFKRSLDRDLDSMQIQNSKKIKKQDLSKLKEDTDISSIKIKTLAEIRAEKSKSDHKEPDSQTLDVRENKSSEPKKTVISLKRKHSPVRISKGKKVKKGLGLSEISANEVTSTIKDEETQHDIDENKRNQGRKLKLRRGLVHKVTDTSEMECSTKMLSEECEVNKQQTVINEDYKEDNELILDKDNLKEDSFLASMVMKREEINNRKTFEDEENNEKVPGANQDSDQLKFDSFHVSDSCGSCNNKPNKTFDEVLLLEDDDEFSGGSVKGEDELFDEIDDLLAD